MADFSPILREMKINNPLRDEIAIHAMAALISLTRDKYSAESDAWSSALEQATIEGWGSEIGMKTECQGVDQELTLATNIALDAYVIADAMLEMREKV